MWSLMDWINIDENTPNINECILIAFEDKNGYPYCCVGLYDSSGFDGDEHSKNEHFGYEPKYWMYVPSYPIKSKVKYKDDSEEKLIFTFKARKWAKYTHILPDFPTSLKSTHYSEG